MRASLAQLHARLAVTSIYVTHDQTEAMTLGQRVAVMRDGRIVQVDVPQRLYQAPTRSLRRGVHRLAVDEPRRGDGGRRHDRVRAVSSPARPRAAAGARRRPRHARRAPRGVRRCGVRAGAPAHAIERHGRGARGARLRLARLLPRRGAARDDRVARRPRRRDEPPRRGRLALHGPRRPGDVRPRSARRSSSRSIPRASTSSTSRRARACSPR